MSWITLILGTIANIYVLQMYKFREAPMVWVISLLWQWLLLMQLFEAIIWKSGPSGRSPDEKICTMASNAAMVANVTQPIALALVLLTLNISGVESYYRLTAMVIILAYICWLFWCLPSIGSVQCLTPTTQCNHLDLEWWRKIPGGPIPYFIALYSVGLLLIRPHKFSLLLISFITVAFILSAIFYGCGASSMWCFFVTFAPFFTAWMWEASK